MNIKDILPPKQQKALKKLETILGRPIPILFKKIEEGYFSDYEIISFGIQIESDKVVGLGLSYQGLWTLPKSITNLTSLQKLNLSHNHLRTLPKSIGDLKSLERLDLDRNRLTTLPESKGKLSSLKELYLGGNMLTTLPCSIGDLKSLQTLDLAYNHLLTLPESIGDLKSLERLDLKNNQLSTLPESIGKLSSLQKLDLRGNKLTTLPWSIGDLKSLQTLDLGGNKSTTLPESITKLESLQTLSLSYNRFTTLPESISNLKSLQTLDLGGNKSTTLPESISKLTSLQELKLWDNQLSTLPESIGQLSSLKLLRLESNQLTTLPESFSQLKSLENISLSNNNWAGEWANIVKEVVPLSPPYGVLKLCRKLHGIIIFISHAMKDEDKYHILELNNFLEKNVTVRENDMKMNIVHDVLICEEDLIDDIWDFMTKNVPKSHLLLFIATKNSIASEPCRYELFLANKYEIEILPIKGMNIKWEDLRKVGLINQSREHQGNLDLSSPKKKFEFNGENFDDICKQLSDFIKMYESELKKSKTRSEIELLFLEDIKKEFIDVINSREFRNLMKDNLEGFKRTYQDLSKDKITIFEYYYKLGKILKRKEN